MEAFKIAYYENKSEFFKTVVDVDLSDELLIKHQINRPGIRRYTLSSYPLLTDENFVEFNKVGCEIENIIRCIDPENTTPENVDNISDDFGYILQGTYYFHK